MNYYNVAAQSSLALQFNKSIMCCLFCFFRFQPNGFPFFFSINIIFYVYSGSLNSFRLGSIPILLCYCFLGVVLFCWFIYLPLCKCLLFPSFGVLPVTLYPGSHLLRYVLISIVSSQCGSQCFCLFVFPRICVGFISL